MCSIFGALVWGQDTTMAQQSDHLMHYVYDAAFERGRDGRGFSRLDKKYGWTGYKSNERALSHEMDPKATPVFARIAGPQVLLGNTRAEPTTEFVANKSHDDQQPYNCSNWTIVHNGTIANDKELRKEASCMWPVKTGIDSAAIAEALVMHGRTEKDPFDVFYKTVKSLIGSYAIIASNGDADKLFVAANYRPLWYTTTSAGVFFASTRESFPAVSFPKMLEPYTVAMFSYEGDNGYISQDSKSLRTIDRHKPSALVVCSGGLDSVVAAVFVQKALDYDVELIHFMYGSRAEGPEVEAVKAVAEYMGVKLKLFPLPVYDKADSPLLRSDSAIAGGEAGAEFAHEWVPARNLLLLSVATAYAEAKGHTVLVLGNNLEEAGAYPDNEPEFIAKFNDLLPFAIGDGKKLKVIMPVGNLMKHEIVALGHELGAPMHLTWSCYRAGTMHCGTCGPCFMRRTAFNINKLPEVIDYAS